MEPQDTDSAAVQPRVATRLSRRKKLAFAALLVVLVLLVSEAGLRVLSALSPRVADALAHSSGTKAVFQMVVPTIPDERLGFRPNPSVPDHDSLGFRNARIPDTVDIVALGDSQTYGVGVARNQAWPQRLEQKTGQSVYNMAFGGYGPTHSAVLVDEALALHPRIVIEAIYAGNDFWDCYHMVYVRGQFPEWKSTDPSVLNQIARTEFSDPLQTRIEKFSKLLEGDFEAINGELSAEDNARFLQQVESLRPAPTPVRDFFDRNSKLFALGRETCRRVSPEPKDNPYEWEYLKLRAEISGRLWEVFEQDSLGTILVPEYRMCGLNSSDPRINEGHRVALAAIRKIDDRVRNANARFVVLLIPTKELVFAEFSSPSDPLSALPRLVDNERYFWKRTKAALAAARIPTIDALPALVDCLRTGRQPYPRTPDGHPNATGQQAIADCVAASLEDILRE